ncbi:delta(14)-sterol reductase-like [Camellia sinensis]|uniref:delta(14)-sterol reductase-like n=1 Tax=Camellia sinensis TaxID=4442 RepID=UPI0010366271|nr:delta(14)-sterol reductase-like [Camellia sinensis]
MDLNSTLLALIPSSTSVTMLLGFFAYLAIAGSIIPGKLVPGVILSDGTRLQYRCNGLISLILLVALLGIGVWTDFTSPTAIADRGLELLSAAFILSFLVTLVLYVAGRKSHDQGSSLKPHVTGNLIHDWWFGIQLNPQFMGIDLKYVIRTSI